jgi:LytS/YehU family sensor histidine kinase
VERIRFGPRLDVEIEAQGGAGDALVPAMMIQTLVENAVKHGVSARPGPGRIEVRATCAGEALELAVRDTGPGFGPAGADAPGAGLGLRNVRERLAAHFGPAAALRVERDEREGMTVVGISMPLRRATPAAAPEEVG